VSTPGQARRRDLDVVRGLAVLLALGWHFARKPTGVPPLTWAASPGGAFGWAGVDLFFVLSGFLIGRLVFTETVRTGRFDGWRFSVRRAFKLWPVLYLYLVVQAVAGTGRPGDTSGSLWPNAVHLQNYLGTSVPHLWSLAVEEQFYLALALLLPLAARRRVRPRTVAVVLGAVLVVALALRVWATARGLGAVDVQWQAQFRADSLAAGVLLAWAAVHRPDAFDALRRRRLPLLAVVAGGTAWLAVVSKASPWGSTAGYTVAWVWAAAILLLVLEARWVGRAGWVSRPMAALGRNSYGIYVWHVLAAQLAIEALGRDYTDGGGVNLLVKYAAALVVGVVATQLVERPSLWLRDRLLPGAAQTKADRPVTDRPTMSVFISRVPS